MRKILILLALLCAPLVGSAQFTLYVTSGNGIASSLYTVNPTTAAATLIGPVMAGTSQLTITGLAFHPITGVLYGVTGSENAPVRVFVSIDPVTAQAVIIGSLGFTSNDISFAADGTLYSWTARGGPLGTINLATGAQTQIGSAVNGTQSNGLAFAPGGALYLAGPVAPGNLYSVNTTTGAITSVVAVTGPSGLWVVNAMASDPTGLLYGTVRNTSSLITINSTTGAMNLVGSLSFGEADALAFGFVPIPEPATWALMLAGLGAAFAARRARL